MSTYVAGWSSTTRAQVAGVVIGDVLGDRSDRDEPLLADQLVQQLGVVHDLEVPAQLRVLIRQAVEAVRTRGDDLALARLPALEQHVPVVT
ncbi:hypothetical protein GCM10010470_47310 [Saccharopolyspora taberi]|uniref:ADP-ribosylglycohydrolase n=1 Tax=Saccharopolyspora taberi TaxID=60895 RepID=A0ABN3VIJ9_9PSEU